MILLNGRKAGTGNVAKIMTKNIERIEIIRGPASVQYGSSAIGGLINVITKEGKGKPSAFAEGNLGSFDYQEAGVGGSGEVKGFDFSVSFSRSTRDNGYDNAEGDKYYNSGYDKKEHASLNLGYEFLPGNRIGIIYTNFDADGVGAPYYISQNDLDDYTEQSNESIDFIYDGSLPEGPWSWKAGYFSGEDKYRFVDPIGSNPDGWDDGIPDEREVDIQGSQAQITFNPGQYRLTAGVDWVNYDVDASTDYEYDNPAYFLLGKAVFMDRSLFLSAGIRYDDYEVEAKGKGRDETKNNWTPNVGISYLPIDDLKLRANYSEGFRMPAGDALFGSTWYQANPGLEPEEMQTYEAGIDFSHQALDTSLTCFYNDFDNRIEARQTAVMTWKYKNIEKAATSGLEGEFSYDIGSLFDWQWAVVPYGSFVWLTESEDEETGDDLLNTSDLTCSWGLRVLDHEGFSADLNFAYTGKQDIDYYDPLTYQVTRLEKGGFTVANLTLQDKILDLHRLGSITLKGEIRNLLNKDYEYVKEYPMPGRSFFLGIRYDWGKS